MAKRLSRLLLGYVALISAVLSWVAVTVLLARGHTPPAATVHFAVGQLIWSGIVLWTGYGVKKLRDGKKTRTTALEAVKIVVFAQASTVVTAIVGGWAIGAVLVGISQLDAVLIRTMVIENAFLILTSIILVTCGLITENWCLIDTDDDDSKAGGAPSSPIAQT